MQRLPGANAHRCAFSTSGTNPVKLVCAITTARTVKPRVVMAKIINVDEDGMITGVEPSPQGFLFEFREVRVHDLESLGQSEIHFQECSCPEILESMICSILFTQSFWYSASI